MVKAGYREEQLEQLEDFFEFAPVGMHLVDGEGRFTRANIAMLEVLGYFGAKDELMGRSFAEAFVDRSVFEDIHRRLSAGEVVNHVKTRLRGRDGEPREVTLDASARLEGGRLRTSRWFLRPAVLRELPSARAVAASPDVTEKLASSTEEEKARSLDELNDFFDNAPVGVHFVGLNGVMMRANRAEVRLLGFEDAPEGYIGRHVREIHHEKAVVETLLERLVAGTPVIGYEAYLKRRDGGLQPVHIYSGLRLKGGKFQNTRCFLFENPNPRRPPTESHVAGFSWPRNDA
ncbi:MAG TPA: PAS domain-containing protein [Myxococcaceae bacterium]|jgi:PAS domain S-box-containing protein